MIYNYHLSRLIMRFFFHCSAISVCMLNSFAHYQKKNCIKAILPELRAEQRQNLS